MNKKLFKVKISTFDVTNLNSSPDDTKEVELAILKPTAKVRINAQLVYNKSWAEAEKNGSPLARNLDEVAERNGVWSKEKADQVETLGSEIISLEKKLRGGAANFASKDEAKSCALKIRELRSERLRLLRSKDDLYIYTAENFADNARMGYFISQGCIYNDNGKCFFKSYDDYVEQGESEVVREATRAYIELISADLKDENLEMYETKFLIKYGYANEKGQLVNENGQLITTDGKIINDKYEYILPDNSRCDVDGTPLTDEGDYKIEYIEFS